MAPTQNTPPKKGTHSKLLERLQNDHNITLRVINGISDEAIEYMYAQAYNTYQSGTISKAAEIFVALCMLDHLDPRYWKGLAACLELLEDLDSAGLCYTIAIQRAPNDMELYLRAARISLVLQRPEAAREILTLALRLNSKPNSENLHYHQMVVQLLDELDAA